jgi:UTP--glucose-1-phosphate uridylyltransferase
VAPRTVSKVVIPVAGLGSRFLPVTKVLPKELLPIIDKPIIHYIVEEAVAAGIETIVFVTSRPKVLIEDYFDPADLTSYKLAEADKLSLIEEVAALSKKIDIVSVRQYEAKGLGHAVLMAAPIVGHSNFAVMLGDDIVIGKNKPAIGQCLDLFKSESEGSVVGVIEVPMKEVSHYGIAEVNAKGKVERFIEKPSPGQSKSNLALPGRYIFEADIFEHLRKTPLGKNNELQLTDAMELLRKTRGFWAKTIDGDRFDTGDKLGYLKANISFALKDKRFKEDLSAWLSKQI